MCVHCERLKNFYVDEAAVDYSGFAAIYSQLNERRLSSVHWKIEDLKTRQSDERGNIRAFCVNYESRWHSTYISFDPTLWLSIWLLKFASIAVSHSLNGMLSWKPLESFVEMLLGLAQFASRFTAARL
jgi:hypothetical protein